MDHFKIYAGFICQSFLCSKFKYENFSVEPRLISNIPLRVIVNESSTTNLDCGGAETNPVIAYYQWTGTKVVQTPGSKLEFLATSREDAGDYFCKACNCDVPTNHDLCPWTACSVTRQITLEVECKITFRSLTRVYVVNSSTSIYDNVN